MIVHIWSFTSFHGPTHSIVSTTTVVVTTGRQGSLGYYRNLAVHERFMTAVKVLSTRKTHTVPSAPVAAQVRHDNYLWKAAAQQLFQLNKQDAFAFAAFIDSWGPGPDHLDSGQ